MAYKFKLWVKVVYGVLCLVLVVFAITFFVHMGASPASSTVIS